MKCQRQRHHLSSNRISRLPQTIIENILCLLPIQDAARTSILSREWRYTWNKIPKLVFSEFDFEVSTDKNHLSVMEQNFSTRSARRKMNKRGKFFYAVYQVLLMHQGPMLEFTLEIDADDSCVEIDHIITHLSMKNTIKKLTLVLGCKYRLPLSIFSLYQLTDLHLQDCDLRLEPVFNGFDCLTTLFLYNVDIYKTTLLHLLSNCPLLKNLTLIEDSGCIFGHDYDIGENFASTLIEVFDCLPVIEQLTISLNGVQGFGLGMDPRELPTSLVHLKYICLEHLDFDDKSQMYFLLLLMRSSPNLEKIKLRRSEGDHKNSEIDKDAGEKYLDNRLENLELTIECSRNWKPILEFAKLILAKSPVLKKVRIIILFMLIKDEELEELKKMSRILLRHPHASPLVEIIVERFRDVRQKVLEEEACDHLS